MVQDDKAKSAEKQQNTTNKKINISVIYRTHLKWLSHFKNLRLKDKRSRKLRYKLWVREHYSWAMLVMSVLANMGHLQKLATQLSSHDSRGLLHPSALVGAVHYNHCKIRSGPSVDDNNSLNECQNTADGIYLVKTL